MANIVWKGKWLRWFGYGIFLFVLAGLVMPSYAAPQLSIESISRELKSAEENNNLPNQPEIVSSYQKTLHWLNELERTNTITASYQNSVNNYQTSSQVLEAALAKTKTAEIVIDVTTSLSQIEQKITQTNSRLLELSQDIQQKQDQLREIGESLIQLPIKQSETSRNLFEAEQTLRMIEPDPRTTLARAKQLEAQAEINYYKAYTNELALQQLSAPNRQALLQLEIDILKSENKNTERLLELLRVYANDLRTQRQQETEQLARELNELNEHFPQEITDQLNINRELAERLAQQSARRDQIASEQRKIANDILSVRTVFNTLREQAQWLSMSTALGEIQRAQLARLPKEPKPQQLDNEIAAQRVQQLSIQDALKKVDTFDNQLNNFKRNHEQFTQLKSSLKIVTEQDIDKLSADHRELFIAKRQEVMAQQNMLLRQLTGSPGQSTELFTDDQLKLFEQQTSSRHELLNALLAGSETLTIELAQLKVLNSQLIDALSEVKQAAHRYLFWAADVDPLRLSYPIDVLADLNQLLSLNTLSELLGALRTMATTPDSISFILFALLLVAFGVTSRKHYNAFLERASLKVGRVTQDHFSLTLKTVLWSITAALPLPILWGALSYGLQEAWQFPIAVALGNGVSATLPIMWAFMICASFAHPKGLFTVHLGWSPQRVMRSMRYYKLTVWAVVPILIALIFFDSYNDREFAGTLGRACFFLLCAALVLMATNLRRAGVPLYLDSKGSGENFVNDTLWTLLRYSPIAAAIAAAFGYLATSQALLARLDMSVIIWFALLIIYHIILRWMLIQRRRIEFDRAKQRRADRLAQRARSQNEEENSSAITSSDSIQELEEPVIDLDTISAQSLALVRSILAMIALVSIIALWSEIHSAFSFLENIHLWDVTSTVQGIETSQPITLSSLFIAIIAFIITAQLIRNLPALLELAILQHLDLAPGTGYAITTLTKYILMLIGCTVAFSLMGVDWSKLQWLIAALGVGLGFGLQEIFANFISGLIILFEKPIRINDMVTIRDLTGTVTKINTRATTILDWDRKEIIVPNKAFITEQFINWSLSDSVTRIVTTVPANIDVDPSLVTQILKESAEKCTLILDNPAPEAFLVDIQQGIQIFELRVFAGEMAHRMPLRHELHQLIMQGFKDHNLELPFPPFQMREQALARATGRRSLRTGDI